MLVRLVVKNTMKLLLFLCFVLAASEITAFAAEVTDILKILDEYITECIEEGQFELNADDITAIFKDVEKTNDIDKEGMEQITQVTSCFFHKAGIYEPDGEVNIAAAMAIQTLLSMEKNDAEELLQNCTSITGFDGQDMTYAILKCFAEKDADGTV